MSKELNLNPIIDILNNEIKESLESTTINYNKSLVKTCKFIQNIHDLSLYNNNDKVTKKFILLIENIKDPLHTNELLEVIKASCYLNINLLSLSKIIINCFNSIDKIKNNSDTLINFLKILILIKQSKNVDLITYCENTLRKTYLLNNLNSIKSLIIDIDINENICFISELLCNDIINFKDFTNIENRNFLEMFQNNIIKNLKVNVIEYNNYKILRHILLSIYTLIKYDLNINNIFNNYLPLVTKNLYMLEPNILVSFVNLYSFNNYINVKKDNVANNFNSNLSDNQLNVSYFFRYSEIAIFQNGLDSFKLSDIISLLDSYSSSNQGSSQFYLEIDKYIGINIDRICPDKYLAIVSSFINSGKYRNKFILLMQKKILENKENISISNLINLALMYHINIKEKYNSYILTKLENYFILNISKASNNDICNLNKIYLSIINNHDQIKNVLIYLNMNIIKNINDNDNVNKSNSTLLLNILSAFSNATPYVIDKSIYCITNAILCLLNGLEKKKSIINLKEAIQLYNNIASIQPYIDAQTFKNIINKLIVLDNLIEEKNCSLTQDDKSKLLNILQKIGYNNNRTLVKNLH